MFSPGMGPVTGGCFGKSTEPKGSLEMSSTPVHLLWPVHPLPAPHLVLELAAQLSTLAGGQTVADSGFVKVAETEELSPGQMRSVTLGRERLLLANVDGSFYVISDTCTHMAGTLSAGDLDGEQVRCPLHGATFNVMTGEVIDLPARTAVSAREVRISGNDILVGPARS